MSICIPGYLTVFKLRGRTHDCASDAELLQWHRDLNQLLKSIGSEHVKLWQHMHHHRVDDYPQYPCRQAFAQLFDTSYRRGFEQLPLMVNELYLTVVYDPVGDRTQKLLARFERPSADDLRTLQAEALGALEDIAGQLQDGLQAYGIERLGIYYRDRRGQRLPQVPAEEGEVLDREDLLADGPEVPPPRPSAAGHAFSSALEWLGFLVNGAWALQPVCHERIRSYRPCRSRTCS